MASLFKRLRNDQRQIKLRKGPISSTSSASYEFGNDPGLLIALPSRSCFNPFYFTVLEGYYAIVSNGWLKRCCSGFPTRDSACFPVTQ